MQAEALEVFAEVGGVALPDLPKQLGINDDDQALLHHKVFSLANHDILRLVSPEAVRAVGGRGGYCPHGMLIGGCGSVDSSKRFKNHSSGRSSSINTVGVAALELQMRKHKQQQLENGGFLKENGIKNNVDEIVDMEEVDDNYVFGNSDGADVDDTKDIFQDI